jgi:DNA-binding response OmpR family regulator
MDNSKWILIIEDEQYQRVSFSLILGKNGYQVTLASSGTEACSYLQCQSYDLALLDLHLDDADGLELLTQFQDCNPDMKVLIITGQTSQDIHREALEKGADDVIYKPVSPQELLEKISLILS